MRTVLILLLTFSLSNFLEAQNFEKIDLYAKSAPANAEKSIESLGKYLNQAGSSDVDKVRAYYVWLADNIAYDTKTFFSNNPNPKTGANDALKRRKAVCQGYAELFKAFCETSNVECFIISGYSKGYGFNPKREFTSSDHAWNAVKVNGEWKLLDATWGAGYLNQKLKYEKAFTEKYFLSDPKIMVLDHLPVDPMWQLLDCPVNLGDFKLNNEELTEKLKRIEPCFSYNDTINNYTQLSSIEQQVNSAERALHFNPSNQIIAGYAYMNLGAELSLQLPPLYEAEQYQEALALNKLILAYNEKAYRYIKQSNSPQSKQMANICKQNISSMKENISSLEKFMK